VIANFYFRNKAFSHYGIWSLMSLRKTLLLFFAGWFIAISVLQARLNPESVRGLGDYFRTFRKQLGVSTKKFKIGFMPVTCHLTCPVTDFINRSQIGTNNFDPIRFNGFPEIKESFLAGHLPGTFILAPMAMALREQGVPIKIVYLGHRDGSAMMVHKDSSIYRIEDLKGKRIAIPGRFANQRLLIYKALRERGMKIEDVEMVEMPPPDMPAALSVRAVDAITSGEPFMAQTELDGYGRILYLTKDVWPNFISCVLAVNENTIATRREEVQALVDGIAKSGKWLDTDMAHRMSAAQFVSKNYYMQDPRLLTHVLSKPADRVKYTRLSPLKRDFEEIEALGIESGILKGTARFEDYVDVSFAEVATDKVEAWNFEGPKP
jgi:NitT/TauT family transport system substrate-binding protein